MLHALNVPLDAAFGLARDGAVVGLIGGLGPIELVIILVIVLLIFGPMKLPQIGDALGKSVRSFKSAVSGKDKEPVDVTPERSAAQLEDKARAEARSVEVEAAEDQQQA